jgi:Group II intron, maturase-specific domain
MAQVRARIREATSRRFVGHPIAWVVAGLNRVLRGWGAYFRYGDSARKFAQIDATSTSTWRSSPASSADATAGTTTASPGGGSPAWGSACSAEACDTALRMPDGERCRKAVRENCMHGLTGGRWSTTLG